MHMAESEILITQYSKEKTNDEKEKNSISQKPEY